MKPKTLTLLSGVILLLRSWPQQALRPREHRIFFGALDLARLSFAERMMAKALRAPAGDFRNWEAIDAWTAQIAQDLG